MEGEGHVSRGKLFLRKVLFFFLASIALSVLFYMILASIFSTEEEKRMALESELIREEYESMERDVTRLENVVAGLQERDKEIYHNIFEAYPPSLSLPGSDSTYSNDADSVVTFGFARQSSERINAISGRGRECQVRIDNIMKVLSSGNVILANIPSMIPVPEFNPSKAGASVGMKIHPLYKTLKMHNGLDIVVPEQTDVYAAAGGVVSEVKKSAAKEGNVITIDHGNGYVTRYSHLGNMYVRQRQKVSRGGRIALVGNSGSSFAPHLHYEVIFRGRYLEPVHFFFSEQTPQDYRQTMLTALNNGQSMD